MTKEGVMSVESERCKDATTTHSPPHAIVHDELASVAPPPSEVVRVFAHRHWVPYSRPA